MRRLYTLLAPNLVIFEQVTPYNDKNGEFFQLQGFPKREES